MLLTKDSLGSWRPYEYDIKPWIQLAQLKLEREKNLLDTHNKQVDAFGKDPEGLDTIWGLQDSSDPFKKGLFELYKTTDAEMKDVSSKITNGESPLKFKGQIQDIKNNYKKIKFGLATIAAKSNLESHYNSNYSKYIYSEVPQNVDYQRIANNWTPVTIDIANVRKIAKQAGMNLNGENTEQQIDPYNRTRVIVTNTKGIKQEDLEKMIQEGVFDDKFDEIRRVVGYDNIIDEGEKRRLDDNIIDAFKEGFKFNTSSKLTANGVSNGRSTGSRNVTKEQKRIGSDYNSNQGSNSGGSNSSYGSNSSSISNSKQPSSGDSNDSSQQKRKTQAPSGNKRTVKNKTVNGKTYYISNGLVYDNKQYAYLNMTESALPDEIANQVLNAKAEGGLFGNKYANGGSDDEQEGKPVLMRDKQIKDPKDNVTTVGKYAEEIANYINEAEDLFGYHTEGSIRDLLKGYYGQNDAKSYAKDAAVLAEKIYEGTKNAKDRDEIAKLHKEGKYFDILQYALDNIPSSGFDSDFYNRVKTTLVNWNNSKLYDNAVNGYIDDLYNYITKFNIFDNKERGRYSKDGVLYNKNNINNPNYRNLAKYGDQSFYEILQNLPISTDYVQIGDKMPKEDIVKNAKDLESIDTKENSDMLLRHTGSNISRDLSQKSLDLNSGMVFLPEQFIANEDRLFTRTTTSQFPFEFNETGIINNALIPGTYNSPSDIEVENESDNINLGQFLDIKRSLFAPNKRSAKFQLKNLINHNTGFNISEGTMEYWNFRRNDGDHKGELRNPFDFRRKFMDYVLNHRMITYEIINENGNKTSIKAAPRRFADILNIIETHLSDKETTANILGKLTPEEKAYINQKESKEVFNTLKKLSPTELDRMKYAFESILGRLGRSIGIVITRYQDFWDQLIEYGVEPEKKVLDKNGNPTFEKGIKDKEVSQFFTKVMKGKVGSEERNNFIKQTPNLGARPIQLSFNVADNQDKATEIQTESETETNGVKKKEKVKNPLIDFTNSYITDNNALTTGKILFQSSIKGLDYKPIVSTLDDRSKTMGMAEDAVNGLVEKLDGKMITSCSNINYSPELNKITFEAKVKDKEDRIGKDDGTIQLAVDPGYIIDKSNGEEDTKIKDKRDIEAYRKRMLGNAFELTTLESKKIRMGGLSKNDTDRAIFLNLSMGKYFEQIKEILSKYIESSGIAENEGNNK